MAPRRSEIGLAELESSVPGLREGWDFGLLDATCADIDVAGLHNACLAQFQRDRSRNARGVRARSGHGMGVVRVAPGTGRCVLAQRRPRSARPLDPHPTVGPRQAQDILDSIEIAALLGVKRVVTMSGTPAASAGGTRSAWNVLPWHSAFLDVRDYQWHDVLTPCRRCHFLT